MTVDAALKFYMDHNGHFINWLFVSILVLALILMVLALLQKNQVGETGTGIQGKEIESTLRKVLEEKIQGTIAAGVPAAPNPSATSTMANADVSEVAILADLDQKTKDLEALKATVAEKDKILEELRKTAASAALGGADPAELEKMKAKLQELEGKLTEYSIIEDDIADLSLYKEENARLHAELEALKKAGTGSSSAPASDATNADPVPTPEPPPNTVPETGPAPETTTVSTPEAADAAGNVSVAVTETTSAVASESEPVSAPAPADTNAESGTGAGAPDPLSGEVEVDQMMAQMAKLMEETPEDAEVKNPLDDELDTERIAQEADMAEKPKS